MSKQGILEKLSVVIQELKIAGDQQEADWLSKIQSELIGLSEQVLPVELRKKLVILNQKLVSPRGYVDTFGNLDMASWANLLDALSKDVRETYKVP